jgi:hypothetical protein
MRTLRRTVLLGILFVIFVARCLSAQVDQNIYRIVISMCPGSSDRYSQSGFKLAGKGALITALHGVAGCASIEAFGSHGAPAFGGQKLRINRADVPHDVAELVSGNAIPLQGGLSGAATGPQALDVLTVYGFPAGRVVSRGQKVRLGSPPLMNIFSWVLSASIRSALIGRMSPDPNIVEFVDVADPLLPGHSGAPLLNQSNEVVAVGDGGLGDNRSWAIPWNLVQFRPFSETDNQRLGHAQGVLFAYDNEIGEVPTGPAPAVIGSEGTVSLGTSGFIPGLRGELNPILDSSNRTYLYAKNVAIDGGKPQPVDLTTNHPLQVEDSDGNRFSIAVTTISSTGSTISYKKLAPSQSAFINQLPVRVTDDAGSEVSHATVEVTFPDGTFKSTSTNTQGQALLEHLKGPVGTITVTQAEYRAVSITSHDLTQPLVVSLHRALAGGSLTLPNNTGQIPGLDGRLNPILDNFNRTYLYADNIGIEGGQIQPVTFSLNTPFVLEDSHGHRFSASVVLISNSSSTIQYDEVDNPNIDAVKEFQVVAVDGQGAPVSGADVAVVFGDGTVLAARTNTQGAARFQHLKQQLVDVYIGRASYSAAKLMQRDARQPLDVTLSSNGLTSSAIFFGRTGSIPGLQGRLAPILDVGRQYFYADGIQINGGSSQPVNFAFGDTETLRDSTGTTFEVKFIAITSNATLLEYRNIGP